MEEPGKFLDHLVTAPTLRRLWLLSEALKCEPLDQAIELARRAEFFIAPSGPRENEQAQTNPASHDRIPGRSPALQPIGRPVRLVTKRSGLGLSCKRREQLLDCLAAGHKNADLAREFGLTPRQVQGFRMGAARAIAKGRQPVIPTSGTPVTPLSVEDVVRYLRQQDDVVVPQKGGEFLVNGRFRLGLVELVSRANRMRNRQGKSEFGWTNAMLTAR